MHILSNLAFRMGKKSFYKTVPVFIHSLSNLLNLKLFFVRLFIKLKNSSAINFRICVYLPELPYQRPLRKYHCCYQHVHPTNKSKLRYGYIPYTNDYTTNFVIWNSSTLFHNVARPIRATVVHKKKLQAWSWNKYHVSWDLQKNCLHCKLCTEISVNSKRLFRHVYATKPDNKSHCLIIHDFRKWIIQYVSYMLQPLTGMLLHILYVTINEC